MKKLIVFTFLVLFLLVGCSKGPAKQDDNGGICQLDNSGNCSSTNLSNTPISSSASSSDTVKVGDVVEVNYVGKFMSGQVFDTNIQDVAEKYNMSKSSYQPLKFKVGSHSMIKGFEDGVIGMKLGEEKIIKIPSEEAYGKKNPALILPMTYANFTENFPKVQNISAGVKVTFPYNGQLRSFHIYNVTENSTGKYVLLDFNNPMAGEDLEFYIKLVSINP